MALRFPRRSGRVAPNAGDTGERDSAEGLDEGLDERTPLDEPRRPTDEPATEPRPGLTSGGVPVAPVVVPRWIQLVALPLALLGLWALARAAGTVLLILVAASTVALILNPLVRKLARRGVPRGVAIFLLYLAVFAFVAGLGVILANPISTQITHFSRGRPALRRPGQSRPGRCAALARPAGHPRADPAAGADRAPVPPALHRQALERHRLVLPATCSHRSSRPDSTSSSPSSCRSTCSSTAMTSAGWCGG